MGAIVLETGKLNLPKSIVKRLKSKSVEVVETKDGILLKPTEDAIKKAKGFLKGSLFTTEKYFRQKKEDKKLEQ